MSLERDTRWDGFGITRDYLEERAEWMSRDPGLPTVVMYFQMAGSLMRFAWYDYRLSGLVLFQAIAGFEGVLRMRFEATRETTLHELTDRVLSERIILDSTFRERRPFPKDLRKRIEKGKTTYAEQVLSLARALRNSYFHGDYVLFPECLHLAVHMREAADAVLAGYVNPRLSV